MALAARDANSITMMGRAGMAHIRDVGAGLSVTGMVAGESQAVPCTTSGTLIAVQAGNLPVFDR